MNERIINPDFTEKLILKGMLSDKTFLVLVTNAFEPEYFTNTTAGKIFEYSRNYVEEFKKIPPRDIIKNSVDDKVEELFTEIDEIDYNISENYDHLVTETNEYLKDQAIKNALNDSIHIVADRKNSELVRQKIEYALCKDLKVDLGLAYFAELGERLRRIFTASENRIPTYFPVFDETINGGFPPFTFNVMCAKIHGFKSCTMANFAARQALHGHNVVVITLEMSQDMFAQRFDAIFSQLDINRMYFGDQRSQLMNKMKDVKANRTGELYIKQYPTGAASIKDFRIYLRELLLRDIKFGCVYVDYINLMKSAYKKSNDLYTSVKSVAEEIRALSFEFEVPMISVSQLNREGSFVGFEQVDFNYIAESLGVPATADFMSIIGINEDNWVYQHELHNKIVKNRLGGRVGQIINTYYDERTLKMYDESELDLWLADAQLFDETRLHAPEPTRNRNDNRRRRN